MKYLVTLLFIAAVAPAAFANPSDSERRCGWLSNPTPANWWLTDADGTWTIGAQGGYQAPGIDLLPSFEDDQWVRTNGYYGYGCACLDVILDRDNERVQEIFSGEVRPLTACENDPALPAM
jgi:hypothetical protein